MMTFIGTANPGFSPYAMEELRRRIPGTSVSGEAAGETFRFTSGEREPAELLKELRRDEPVFLRHLFPLEAEYPVTADPAATVEALTAYARALEERVPGRKVAVQIRKTQESPFPFSSAEARDIVAEVVRELGGESVVQDADQIVSVYASGKSILFGCSDPKDNLSDWPGGAVRFRREEGLLSRAAFKLLEAERAFKLPLDRFNHALDLGAAPGGWSSVLLDRGLKVTAVDPAEMDPSLYKNPRFRHLKQNASDVSFPPGTFDLLVCDMSWDPHRTCRLVSALSPAMTAGASGIITLKLMYRKPLQTLRELMEEYADHFDIRKVKQLFHNREEVTMWVRRKP
ncbi:methyltransferase domain-containing protein [Cohnella pontilimi]|uniref:Methyltransferase domain-containing protein n=1 Tax=Cohnella pontilimi TaxID=2564100 RepID=A0A4U0FKX7_9BACL|nr:SAM-dependent methyltransferase [Cohnella pontilimi]TJY44222.1 methyltransferase domain-containing protein [Cohnella pontilimi]